MAETDEQQQQCIIINQINQCLRKLHANHEKKIKQVANYQQQKQKLVQLYKEYESSPMNINQHQKKLTKYVYQQYEDTPLMYHPDVSSINLQTNTINQQNIKPHYTLFSQNNAPVSMPLFAKKKVRFQMPLHDKKKPLPGTSDTDKYEDEIAKDFKGKNIPSGLKGYKLFRLPDKNGMAHMILKKITD